MNLFAQEFLIIAYVEISFYNNLINYLFINKNIILYYCFI